MASLLDPPVGDEDRPGLGSALLGLGVVTVLALVLTPLCERLLGLRPNASPRRPRKRRRARRAAAPAPARKPRRGRALRRNGLLFFRVFVTHDPNGRYTGHVVSAETGATVAVTMSEATPFEAKRFADRAALRFERLRLAALRLEERKRLSPYRVTPTGQTIRLVLPRTPRPTRKPPKPPSR